MDIKIKDWARLRTEASRIKDIRRPRIQRLESRVEIRFVHQGGDATPS